MKCFECGLETRTKYNLENGKVISVSKICTDLECNWESFPTQIPGRLER